MATKASIIIEISSLILLNWITITSSVSHEQTLLWTEKADNSLVRIVGIPGNPWKWITSRNISVIGQGMPANLQARIISSRIALGFRYSTQNLFFSDRGFKEIMRTRLRIMTTTTYQYNVTINPVYSGISKEVNGIAVDWLSGSLYWTDALYNWISVCDSQRFEIYRHIVTTGLDKPIGIAVDPVEGLMFWSDWGESPKIERARLDGTNRDVLVKSNLHRPLGMAIDYDNQLLYWVDAWSDSIERVDLEGGHRHSIVIEPSAVNSHVAPWGITIYNHTAFVSDQHHRDIHIININTEERIARLALRNVPYDVMMYDESLQKMTPTQCKDLNCDHICISLGEEKAKCICKHGYAIESGSNHCIPDEAMHQPLWVYSMGTAICSTRINMPDMVGDATLRENSDCFMPNQANVRALGYYGNADLLYYSDTDDMTITRLKMFDTEAKQHKVPISANVAAVKGIAVDWISDNLYWTDEDLGIVVISRVDGRYPHILMSNAGKPRGIDVQPNTGEMFWADANTGAVMKANMDGSMRRVLVDNLDEPEGVTIDIKDGRMFWTDSEGIKTRHTDGTDQKMLYVPRSPHDQKFRSVGVYEDFYGMSDGTDTLYFGNKDTGKLQIGSEHTDASVLGDIIAYSASLQPVEQGPCDEENGGCDHICIPVGESVGERVGERVCKCAIGFHLMDNEVSCQSYATKSRFLLFTDPFHKQIYQIDLSIDSPTPDGIHLPDNIDYPEYFDLHVNDGVLYYANRLEKTIAKVDLVSWRDEAVKMFGHEPDFKGFALSTGTSEVIYADASAAQQIEAVNIYTGQSRIIASGVFPTALAVDDDAGMVYYAQVDRIPGGSKTYLYRAAISDPSNRRTMWDSTFRIQSITVNKHDKKLLWCTYYHIYESSMDGKQVNQLLVDNAGQFAAISASPAGIFASHLNRKTLYKIDRGSNNGVATPITDKIFARITDIKDFYDVRDFDPFVNVPRPPQASTGKREGSKVNFVLLVAIVGSVIAILLLILITAIILWRLKRKPRVTKDNYDTQAHDNPTYTTHQTVLAGKKDEEDPYDTLPGAEGALPDVLKTKKEFPDDMVGGSPDPYKDLTDKQNLVVPAEVVLDVDDAKGLGVKYKK